MNDDTRNIKPHLNGLMNALVATHRLAQNGDWLLLKNVFHDVPDWSVKVKASYVDVARGLPEGSMKAMLTIVPLYGSEFWYIRGQALGWMEGPQFFRMVSYHGMEFRGDVDDRLRAILVKLKLAGYINSVVHL